MDWENLAPWIAIAITLALSILVPVFTQIANNSHQRKMQREKIEYEQSQRKRNVYEQFLLNVGNTVMTRSNLDNAGASVYEMYIYAPVEWHQKLDDLSYNLHNYQWENVRTLLEELSKLISDELRK